MSHILNSIGEIVIGTTPILGGTDKHVLYDNAGVIGEAANFTIESGEPNVTAGSTYLYAGTMAMYATLANHAWFVAGAGPGPAATVGSNIFGFGAGALLAATSSTSDTLAVGNAALASNAAGNLNVAVGNSALTNLNGANAKANTAVGVSAGETSVLGGYNVFIGCKAGQNVTGDGFGGGSLNTIVGGSFTDGGLITGGTITNATQCIVIGAACDVPSATTNGQMSIGNFIYGTGLTGASSTVSSGKIGIGVKAPASELDVVGRICVDSITALDRVNNAIADSWFIAGAGNLTTTALGNVAVGGFAGFSLSSGIQNMLLGTNAGSTLATGSDNVAIGTNAFILGTASQNTCVGSLSGTVISSGTDNTVIGYSAGTGISSGIQNIVIGSGCDVATGGATNGQLTIANFIYGTGLTGTGSTISTGKIGIGVKAPGAELEVASRFATTLKSGLTIATGVITVTGSYHTVDTESAAASDDLDTINGGVDGAHLRLRAVNSARTVVVKDGTGNIQCAGDFSLDNAQDTISLLYDGALSAWLEISRSDNGA